MWFIYFFCRGAQALPAFPGAEGYGSETPGGRGGVIVEVTNLEDAGPGSLRAALEDVGGPRIVVFKVSGTIELLDEIRIEGEAASFLTVAGQTAPGDGIALADFGIDIRGGAHDVVLRHLRIRPGNTTTEWDKDGILLWGNSGTHTYNVLIDHVSLSWATDENANVWENVSDVTFQRCIFAEGSMEGHPSGAHGKGALVGGSTGTTVTIHHSLFAHNDDRNPKISGNSLGMGDIRSNVMFDWGTNNATKVEGGRANLVGNLWIPGPSSSWNTGPVYLANEGTTLPEVYLEDNRGWDSFCATGCADPWSIGVWTYDGSSADADPALYGAEAPFPAPTVTHTPLDDLLDDVLDDVGATLPERDLVDLRIVADVRAGTGELGIGSDYPTLESEAAPDDGDHDGMPDSWELTWGLDPERADDGPSDLDGDGYTNVEEYLNASEPTAWTDPGTDDGDTGTVDTGDTGTPSDGGELPPGMDRPGLGGGHAPGCGCSSTRGRASLWLLVVCGLILRRR